MLISLDTTKKLFACLPLERHGLVIAALQEAYRNGETRALADAAETAEQLVEWPRDLGDTIRALGPRQPRRRP